MLTLNDISLQMNTSLHKNSNNSAVYRWGWEVEQKEGNGTEKTELTFQCLEFQEGKNSLLLNL